MICRLWRGLTRPEEAVVAPELQRMRIDYDRSVRHDEVVE
jgi:hypothetical protein